MQQHPGYWKQYRERHPEYVERNRILQVKRDAKRRSDRMGKFLAKMDATAKGFFSRRGGLFRLIPQGQGLLAKMDAITVKIVAIEGGH
jgi:Ser/Thr protein kinase RdoA (MazF antagonist)